MRILSGRGPQPESSQRRRSQRAYQTARVVQLGGGGHARRDLQPQDVDGVACGSSTETRRDLVKKRLPTPFLFLRFTSSAYQNLSNHPGRIKRMKLQSPLQTKKQIKNMLLVCVQIDTKGE